MELDYLINLGVNVGNQIAVLLIAALGLAIIFGMMGVINMAHGELMMIGAFTVVFAVRSGVPMWLAMALAPIVVGLFGVLIERLLVRWLYGRRIEGTLLATFGLSLILQQGATLLLGSSPQGVATPLGSVPVGRYAIGWYSVVVIVVVVALVGAVLLLFTRTRYGLLARATMQNRAMAESLGIDAARVNTITFGVGSALAGAAGALLAPVVAVVPTMGGSLIASAFMTVVLGGPAVVAGTAASAALLGTTSQTVTAFATPVLGTAALLAAAMVLLRLLPNGLSARWRTVL